MEAINDPPTPPSYSEAVNSPTRPSISEIASRPSISTSSSVDGPSEFIFTSDHIVLNLGPRKWNSRHPCYGRNSVIEGFVDLRKLETVKMVELKFVGKLDNILTERGVVVAQSDKILIQHQDVLYDSTDKQRSGTTRRYFSIPIPSYVQGESDNLPPSFIAQHPRYSSQIAYTLKVSMQRKGLRLSEHVKTEIFYLPSSFVGSLPEGSHTKEVSIEIADSSGKSCGFARLTLPTTNIYAAGSTIPFGLRIPSTTSTLASDELASLLRIEFVRRIAIQVRGYRSCRESILGRGKILSVQSGSGIFTMHGTLTGGKVGGDYTWGIPSMVDVSYSLRFGVPKQFNTKGPVPVFPDFEREERIVLTTYGVLPSDDCASLPAVQLLGAGSFQQRAAMGGNSGSGLATYAANYMSIR